MQVIVSDIHGKAQALEQAFRAHPHSRVICLGDALGLGDNSAVLEMLEERNALCVKGNHEVDLCHLYELDTKRQSQISSWPDSFAESDTLYIHTQRDSLGRFFDIGSTLEAEDFFLGRSFRTAFVGH